MNSYQHLIDSKRKFIWLIVILGSIIAIGPLAIDMYLPAFSAIGKSFGASESAIQLSLTSYFIGTALSQLLYGPIIDRFGRRIPLFFGLAIFVITSTACYFARSAEDLIILRFFQALGACAGVVIPRTIVRDIFTPQESARVFSHLMLVMGIAPILAPLAGGLLLEHFTWRAIFAFMIFFGIFSLFSAYFFLPETKGANKDDKISNALKKYSGILKDRNFLVCALSGGLIMAGMFAYITGSPFIYIEIFHIPAKNYSWVFGANAFGFVFFAQINARLLKKISIEKILGKIFFMPAILGVILIFLGSNQPSFWPFTITIFFFIASIGMINPSTTALALANQQAHAGSASALLGTLQFIIATITSFSVSKFSDGTTLPMSLIVGSCGILALLIFKSFLPLPQKVET
jgi:DHA1 family bicyclomycin/chloramphenicol resistance-like MFS transporter